MSHDQIWSYFSHVLEHARLVPHSRISGFLFLSFFLSLYLLSSLSGKFLEDLGNVTFTDSFLGTKDHGGVLFFSPSFQPMEGLAVPSEPFLCGVLLQKLEVPWAKVFPLRLLLRLGLEHNGKPVSPQ